MKIFRIILVVIAIAVAGAGIAVALSSSYTDYSDAIDSAVATGELNEAAAESAPQQQVVNGWLAADLLEIQAQQLNEIGKGQSTTNLMLGLIGAIAAIGLVVATLRPRAVDAFPAGSGVSPNVEPSTDETAEALRPPQPEEGT